jgi:hypothetical protein
MATYQPPIMFGGTEVKIGSTLHDRTGNVYTVADMTDSTLSTSYADNTPWEAPLPNRKQRRAAAAMARRRRRR